MPPSNPPLKNRQDERENAASQTHQDAEQLRSSFVAMVNDVLGCERTSSFTEKNGDLDFSLSKNEDASPALGASHESVGGRFTVKRTLGRGGFGTVYLAHDESLDRDVALKVPHEKLRNDPLLSSQCLKEARLAAKLRHPSIVTIFDISEIEGRIAYIVQEYVQGATLYELSLRQHFSVKQTIAIVMKIAEAIAFAHARGVYHRDLKPANLIVDEAGGIRVLDFGLAVDEELQRTSRGQVAGTVAYMSPEQIEGRTHHLDGRTDIWSLGVIFYELLTGRRPFRGSNEEISDQIVHREAAPPRQFLPAISRRVEACCMKCLSKSVSARYATALDLLEDLQEIIESETLPEEAPNAPMPVKAPPRDTKKFAKETTKDIRTKSRRSIPLLWLILGGAGVVAALFLYLQAASSLLEEKPFSKKPPTDPRTVPMPPGPTRQNVSQIRSQNDLLSKRFSILYASAKPENQPKLSGPRIQIPSNDPCAITFDDPITEQDYKFRLELTPIAQWNGSIAVLIGMNEATKSAGVWTGYRVELKKYEDDEMWYMNFGYVAIKGNQIFDSIQFGKEVRLANAPGLSQVLSVQVQNGKLHGVKIDEDDYDAIAVTTPLARQSLSIFEREYGVPASRASGRVGVMADGMAFDINRALISVYGNQ